ncbi:hypothetical protein CMI47_20770 [Candidatus Pacearchaeota archaeon]|nr:hypothetical protein [Candidatus Pacearchaeota archaeon]|tara:strand:+ start:210 stop:908 length:699 start_codon:yes stop_codon:yes gene_type:complete
MALKESDLVLCTVKKIEKTTVFVDIEPSGQGTIVLSEIAAGRIRNLRDYVSPGRKIVCKILKISKGHIDLSLRRVTSKEKEEVTEAYKKEATLKSMLKTFSKDPEKILDSIKAKSTIPEFMEEARENPKIIESFLSKTDAAKLTKILADRPEKQKTIKKTFKLMSIGPSGIKDLKAILETKEAEINYLGSSKFSISIKTTNPKEAEVLLEKILKQIKEKAQKHKTQFDYKEK